MIVTKLLLATVIFGLAPHSSFSSKLLPHPKSSLTLTSSLQAQYIPITGLSPIFPDSLLIFRGDTTLFNFEQVHRIGTLSLHISSATAEEEFVVYSRLKSVNLKGGAVRSVVHHLVLFGISRKTRAIKNPRQNWLESRTLLSRFPQTLIGLTDSNEAWKDHMGTDGGIFTLYSSRGVFISFLLIYDRRFGNSIGYVFCTFCLLQKHMLYFPPDLGSPGNYGTQSLKFDWNEANVARKMASSRRNISEGGQNVVWSFRSDNSELYLKRRQVYGNELIESGWSHGKSSVLNLSRFHIAALKVLFPSITRETHESNSCWAFVCGYLPTRSGFNAACQSINWKNCSYRALRDKSEKISFSTESLSLSRSYDFRLDRNVLEDDEVIFITSERVRQEKEDSPIDIYLNVYDFAVWVVLAIMIAMTGLLLAGVSQAIKNELRHSPHKTVTVRIRNVATDLTETVCYLCVGFLAQYPRSLPLVTRMPGFHRFVTMLRLYMVPWVFGTWFLTNWYMAFMRSSFNFPFPYELELSHWKEFENFSLYMFKDRRKGLSEANHQVTLKGRWGTFCDRKLLRWDAHNFKDEKEIRNCSLERHYHFPITNVLVTDQLVLAGLIHYEKMGIPGGKPPPVLKFNSVQPTPIEVHPIIQWFRHQRDRNLLCVERIHNHYSSATGESMLRCNLELNRVHKMVNRLEVIEPLELDIYTGERYRNLTSVARQMGEDYILKLGERYVPVGRRDPSLDTYSFKCGHVPGFRNGCNPGNTLYWMTRRAEATFVVPKYEFPWYWNLFKKIMWDDPSIKFSHTGPKELKKLRPDGSFGVNGFEARMGIKTMMDYYGPEARWLQRRLRALQHSGILNFLAKWDLRLYPPVKLKQNEILEEAVVGVQALRLVHAEVKATFTIFLSCTLIAAATLLMELGYHVVMKAARYVASRWAVWCGEVGGVLYSIILHLKC